MLYCHNSCCSVASHVRLLAVPWTAAHHASLSFTISQSLLKLASIESVMLSNHLVLCHPLLLLPSIFPRIRVFSNESDLCIRWPNYWGFRFSLSPSNEYSGLITFRIDWFDLHAVQGTLKSLLQHHSLKACISCCSYIHTYILSCVQLCVTPWTVACQAPLSMGFLQARILEWVAMPNSRGSSQLRG